jgi:hypothetical protein
LPSFRAAQTNAPPTRTSGTSTNTRTTISAAVIATVLRRSLGCPQSRCLSTLLALRGPRCEHVRGAAVARHATRRPEVVRRAGIRVLERAARRDQEVRVMATEQSYGLRSRGARAAFAPSARIARTSSSSSSEGPTVHAIAHGIARILGLDHQRMAGAARAGGRASRSDEAGRRRQMSELLIRIESGSRCPQLAERDEPATAGEPVTAA